MSETFDPYHKWLGIKREDQPPTLYGLLGVGVFEDDPDVIEACGDQRMVHLRTYQTGKHSAESQELLNEVARAKITLLNPQKKAEYDKQLREQMGGFVEVIERKKPVEAASKKARPRMLMLGGAVAVGLILLAVIVVIEMKRGSEPARKLQPIAAVSRDRQEPLPSLPPKPAPPERPKERPNESGSGIEPEPTVQPPPAEVAPEEKPPVEPTVAATEPTPPASETAMPKPAKEPEMEPATDQKLPVPSAAEQNKMDEQFNEVYSLSQKRTAEEEIALAKKLFESSNESPGDPVEKFVYFQTAMKAACRGGDPALMLEIFDAMGDEFEVDALEGKQKMLATFVSGLSGKGGKPEVKRIGAFIEAADPVIDEAIDAGRHDLAMNIAEAAYELTRRAGDRELRKRTFDRRNAVRKMADEFKGLATVRETLKTNPDDPAANLAMGRWLYSQRGDWEQALPHLARCSSAAMKALASEELDAGPADRIRLADAWWALGEKVKGKEREALQLHAGQWYEQAAAELPDGLTKVKVERRLAEIAKIDRPASKGPRKTKRAKELAINLPGEVKMEFVLIPAGEFLMGSPDAVRQAALGRAKAANNKLAVARISSEGPQHRVKISKRFYLGKYEVTQAQWATVMGNNPSKFKYPTNPVEQVSWDDIQPFLAELNMAFKRKGLVFALPTEAQWEYACRAGTTTAFNFGDDPAMLAQHGWFKGNSGARTHPVGQGKPNAWGLYDMHGNVCENCSDRYANEFYAQSPPVDPVGPPTGSERVYRSGSYLSGRAELCRSAYRWKSLPDAISEGLGFRLALVLTAK